MTVTVDEIKYLILGYEHIRSSYCSQVADLQAENLELRGEAERLRDEIAALDTQLGHVLGGGRGDPRAVLRHECAGCGGRVYCLCGSDECHPPPAT